MRSATCLRRRKRRRFYEKSGEGLPKSEPFGLEIIAAAFALEIYEVFLLAALVFVKGSVTVNNYGESTLERQ